MDSDYVAWNGERYVWPPPEGWYLASDGRWWAPDTGPDMDLGPVAGYHAESVDADGGAAHQAVTDLGYDPDPEPRFFPDSGSRPGPEDVDARAPERKSSTVRPAEFAEPVTGGPVSGQMAPIADTDPTTAMAAGDGDGGRHPTMVMTEPAHTGTDPHSTVAADPDTGRHDEVSVLEPAEAAPSAGIQRSRTMPMVAAGLLVAAAIVIAALLALLGGDNETQTQQPSASAEETGGASDELVVSTEDEGAPTSIDGAMDDGAMDDAMDDGMDDGVMDDAMSEEEAMTDEAGASTSTSAVGTGEGTETAGLIGQFRTLLEDNQITAAALTGDDLIVFGETACSYATSAGDLPEYEQIRNEALNGAQNDELSIDELRFVVDAAVTVFCAEDATRLGLTATAPVEG